jgi:KUP system potassium uptake protein
VYHVDIQLGFRVASRVDLFFWKIVGDLIKTGELRREDCADVKFERDAIGRYKFVIINSFLSFDNQLPFCKNLLIRIYYDLKGVGIREDNNFALNANNVIFEKYPLLYTSEDNLKIERIHKG